MLKRTAALFLPLLMFASATSNAADGQICYSSFFVENLSGAFGTRVSPQLANETKFSCRSGVQLTLPQLVARGWKVTTLGPVVYSTTTRPDGSASVATRWMLVVTI